MRANGGNIYALAINAGSRIEATGIASKGGDVYLTAGDGSLTAQGEIDATHADGSGGFVETSGAAVDFTGLKVRAGQWLIDPATLTVDQAAANTIDANLASTSVTLKTMAGSSSGPGVQSIGAGDIVVDAPIAWASANTLTLDAYHSIDIDAAVTASGAGKVVLITNDGGSGGDYSFGFSPARFAGSLSFTGAPNSGQALTINGQPYSLIYSEADLVNVNNNLGGFYALAAPLELNTFLFTDSPIASTVATPFTGVFTGLGNSISDLSIRETSRSRRPIRSAMRATAWSGCSAKSARPATCATSTLPMSRWRARRAWWSAASPAKCLARRPTSALRGSWSVAEQRRAGPTGQRGGPFRRVAWDGERRLVVSGRRGWRGCVRRRRRRRDGPRRLADQLLRFWRSLGLVARSGPSGPGRRARRASFTASRKAA